MCSNQVLYRLPREPRGVLIVQVLPSESNDSLLSKISQFKENLRQWQGGRRIVLIAFWGCLLTLFGTTSLGQTTELTGINCNLTPREPATKFTLPVKPINNTSWVITNGFGNVVTNVDIPGLPAGYWQHTGADYVLGGSTRLSEKRPVYAAANGIVVFSTKTATNKNPIPKRGGVVIIKHSAGQNSHYKFLEYKKTFTAGSSFSISYPALETNDFYTYYLHLDPDKITVAQGDSVQYDQQIAETYSYADSLSKYAYRPHVHFEVWRTCGPPERNGYDPANQQFQAGVNSLLLSPSPFPQYVSVTPPVTRVVQPNIVVSRSLTITPSRGPFALAQVLNGSFRITNRGNTSVIMRQVLIGGRLGDICPNDRCPDFIPIDSNVTLNPGDYHDYSGQIKLSQPGTYTFYVAYQTPDLKWEIPVKPENGAVNKLSVFVQGPTPTLTRSNPSSIAASPNAQTITIYGTRLAKVIYGELRLPDGTRQYLYIPLNQLFKVTDDQTRITTKFPYRGTYYVTVWTLEGKSNQFPIVVF
jgi:murein DD-endopeptidase MepM/ murein hydrolase activator NlpD